MIRAIFWILVGGVGALYLFKNTNVLNFLK